MIFYFFQFEKKLKFYSHVSYNIFQNDQIIV